MRRLTTSAAFAALTVVFSLATSASELAADIHAVKQFREGREIFRYATFGDEDFWGGTLGLHEALKGVSPKTALGVGLKVDVDNLPREVVRALREGKVNPD